MQLVSIKLSFSDSVTASEIKVRQSEENEQLQDYSSAMENHGEYFDGYADQLNRSPPLRPQRVQTRPLELNKLGEEAPSQNLNDDLFHL